MPTSMHWQKGSPMNSNPNYENSNKGKSWKQEEIRNLAHLKEYKYSYCRLHSRNPTSQENEGIYPKSWGGRNDTTTTLQNCLSEIGETGLVRRLSGKATKLLPSLSSIPRKKEKQLRERAHPRSHSLIPTCATTACACTPVSLHSTTVHTLYEGMETEPKFISLQDLLEWVP